MAFFQSGDHLLRLHDNVVKKVAEHLNKQSYVWFTLEAAKQHKDRTEGIAFLLAVGDAVKGDEQASLLCKIEHARWQLQSGDVAASEATLEEARVLMNAFVGIVEANIQSHFYLASMEFYKVRPRPCVRVCACACVVRVSPLPPRPRVPPPSISKTASCTSPTRPSRASLPSDRSRPPPDPTPSHHHLDTHTHSLVHAPDPSEPRSPSPPRWGWPPSWARASTTSASWSRHPLTNTTTTTAATLTNARTKMLQNTWL